MLNSMWNGRSEQRTVKVIQRLNIKEVSARTGFKMQDLYNAFYQNRAGGFIQRDPQTTKLYVLATEIDDLKSAMTRRAAGAVKKVAVNPTQRLGPLTFQELSKQRA